MVETVALVHAIIGQHDEELVDGKKVHHVECSCGWHGEVAVWGHHLNATDQEVREAKATARGNVIAMGLTAMEMPRRQRVEGCRYCAEHGGEMMPPHDPSPACESGGYEHCSCDTCF